MKRWLIVALCGSLLCVVRCSVWFGALKRKLDGFDVFYIELGVLLFPILSLIMAAVIISWCKLTVEV